METKSARKLPSPKPSSPLRWMNSKKIGPTTVPEKICSSTLVMRPSLSPSATAPSPSIRMPVRWSRPRSSPWPGTRSSTRS
jgi:hypothetical protein